MARSIEQNEVPQAVKDAFSARFPNTPAEKWEVESQYEVEFEQDGQAVEANFFPDGSLAQVESAIDPDTLPDAIKGAIKVHYPHCSVEEAERVEKADGTVLYEVGLTFEVHYTPEGKIAAMGKDL